MLRDPPVRVGVVAYVGMPRHLVSPTPGSESGEVGSSFVAAPGAQPKQGSAGIGTALVGEMVGMIFNICCKIHRQYM